MTPHVQFIGVEKRYGSVTALRGVSLDVARGSVLALLGPNGAGKSTLFGCLLGTVRATRGQVLVNGTGVSDAHRRAFGYVAERVALYPHRTVMDNALFFARLKGQPCDAVPPQLERVGLRELRDRKVRTLSKGLLQRLGLAIALVGTPELLILDEPFNGLDPALLDQLHLILRDEQRRGATLLVSTHTMSAIEPLATHAAIVLEGALAAAGTLDNLRRAHGEQSLERIYHRIARRHAAESSAIPISRGGFTQRKNDLDEAGRENDEERVTTSQR
jgi:ABC-type multidrug transport system ATPase subunit